MNKFVQSLELSPISLEWLMSKGEDTQQLLHDFIVKSTKALDDSIIECLRLKGYSFTSDEELYHFCANRCRSVKYMNTDVCRLIVDDHDSICTYRDFSLEMHNELARLI